MRYAQLNPERLVMNVIDVTTQEASGLTGELVPLIDGQKTSPGDRWDGAKFIAKSPPPPEDTETIRSIARAALADRRSKEELIARVDVETATLAELRELLAALSE